MKISFAAILVIVLVALPSAPSYASKRIRSGHTNAMSYPLFRFDSPESVTQWLPTDDRVMGGISQSRMRFDAAGHAVFEGVMSLARNGGFASVRAAVAAPVPPAVTHYVIDVRGDGKRYKLNLRMADALDGIYYQAAFETVADTWTTIALPVSAFAPTFRGRRVMDAPPLNPAKVRQVGLMIADKQDGRFALAIRGIAVEAR